MSILPTATGSFSEKKLLQIIRQAADARIKSCYLRTLSVQVDNGPDFLRQTGGRHTLRDAVDEEDELALRRLEDANAVVLLELVQIGGTVVLLSFKVILWGHCLQNFVHVLFSKLL